MLFWHCFHYGALWQRLYFHWRIPYSVRVVQQKLTVEMTLKVILVLKFHLGKLLVEHIFIYLSCLLLPRYPGSVCTVFSKQPYFKHTNIYEIKTGHDCQTFYLLSGQLRHKLYNCRNLFRVDNFNFYKIIGVWTMWYNDEKCRKW